MDNIIKIISVIGTLLGIVVSVITITKTIYTINEKKNNKNSRSVQVNIIKKRYATANVNDSVVSDSYNGSFNTYFNSGNKITHVKIESPQSTSSDDNLFMYAIASLVLIPLVFYIMKNYQWTLIFIFTALSLATLLYNQSKIESVTNMWKCKEYRIHYIICGITAIVPILSSINIFAPMPFLKCYTLVFESKNSWLSQFKIYYVPVLYYLSIIVGLVITALLIFQNIRTSRKFYKSKSSEVLRIKNRITFLVLSFISITGILFWVFYGLCNLASLLSSMTTKMPG